MPKRKRKNEDGSKKEVKYKGVSKRKSGRFQANIRIDGKLQNIGTFDTAKKAARAYDHAAMQAGRLQAGRPPIKLNFQDKIPMDYKPKMKKLRFKKHDWVQRCGEEWEQIQSRDHHK